MNVLSTLPLLSHLVLQCRLPIAPSETFQPEADTAHLALPRLATMHIYDRAPICLYFLQHLDIPPTATVTAILSRFRREQIPELTSWLVAKVSAESIANVPMPSALLIGDGSFGIMRGPIGDRDRILRRWDEGSALGIRVSEEGIGRSTEPVLTWFLRDALPQIGHWTNSITMLDISGVSCFEYGLGSFKPEREALWKSVLRSMPHITKVIMSIDIRLPALLAEPIEHHSSSGSGTLTPRYMLPNLVAVSLETYPFVTEPKTEVTRLMTSLLDWRDALQTRKEAGCADISMVLAYCSNVAEEHLAMLQEVAEVKQIKRPGPGHGEQ
ncbi:hypothetical protein EIP91_004111 [Steccherinum ochraceum]|uniref:Uncharacterized protein n=1 Tax=Steccherinum ochraceum TaxID=92696 RepID=A0A4R0R9E5_9APHY|nr:hypothetical protein EIP91_004111 [Steccherinum ochraceum]